MLRLRKPHGHLAARQAQNGNQFRPTFVYSDPTLPTSQLVTLDPIGTPSLSLAPVVTSTSQDSVAPVQTTISDTPPLSSPSPSPTPTPTPTPTPALPTTTVPSTTVITTTTAIESTTSPLPSTTSLFSSSSASVSSTLPSSSAPADVQDTSSASSARTTSVAGTFLNGTASRTAASAITSATSSTSNVTSGATSHSSGTIVGIVAASLVGVVILFAAGAYLRRRMSRGSGNPFSSDPFNRRSVALPDDPPTDNRPVMGTRNALALARANMGYSDNQTSAGSVGSPPMMPGPPPADAYSDRMAYQPSPGYDHTQLTRRPSAGETHGPFHDANASPFEDGFPHSSPSDNSFAARRANAMSVTPFQQQQYAEISRQLNNPAIAHIAQNSVTYGFGPSHDGPFADPAPVASGSSNSDYGRAMSPPVMVQQQQDQLSPGPTIVSRTLSTTYGSLSAKSPTPGAFTTRSGTPTDPNPQQTYHPPTAVITGFPGVPGLSHPTSRAHSPSFVDGGEFGEQQAARVGVVGARGTMYDEEDAYGGI